KAIWEPLFTFHGFRYVELKLEDEQGQPVTDIAVDAGWVTGVVLYARMAVHGEFDCSHELVNQLQHNIVWGQKSNFLEVPTDCPLTR
ncbi:MAG: family 78 glycoside hydrolase catalytic domain, partial [Phycisphaerales bacterium]|nr:family 78 glycoside hydrolase catalytic domain [Phycisphaerales bacterium]